MCEGFKKYEWHTELADSIAADLLKQKKLLEVDVKEMARIKDIALKEANGFLSDSNNIRAIVDGC